jgi:predicted transposase/invertase (TIGR01784 family)
MIDHIQSDGLSYQYQLIDMHNIDCETLIAIDKPSALVLAVLCDFKSTPEAEVLFQILTRLEQLTGDDEYAYGKYTLALETLLDNRDLKEKLKEAEAMLRTVKFEQLPSYELGFEKGTMTGKQEGIQIGEQRGIEMGKIEGKLEGKLEAATAMLGMGISAEDIASRLDIPLHLLTKH